MSQAERTKDDNPGYVYVLEDYDNGLVKIGRSKNPNKRISELIVGNAGTIITLNKIFCKDYVQGEKYLQSILNRYRLKGEWYSIPEEVIEWIRSFDTDPIDFVANE